MTSEKTGGEARQHHGRLASEVDGTVRLVVHGHATRIACALTGRAARVILLGSLCPLVEVADEASAAVGAIYSLETLAPIVGGPPSILEGI